MRNSKRNAIRRIRRAYKRIRATLWPKAAAALNLPETTAPANMPTVDVGLPRPALAAYGLHAIIVAGDAGRISPESLDARLRHEFCHEVERRYALDGMKGHGPAWRACAVALGVDPSPYIREPAKVRGSKGRR